jgi:hypothetical protein
LLEARACASVSCCSCCVRHRPPAEFRQDLNVPLLPLRCRQALADATRLDADVERACG